MKIKLLVEIELEVPGANANVEAPLRGALADGPDDAVLTFSTGDGRFHYDVIVERWSVQRMEIER
jgi:hypothetical protein